MRRIQAVQGYHDDVTVETGRDENGVYYLSRRRLHPPRGGYPHKSLLFTLLKLDKHGRIDCPCFKYTFLMGIGNLFPHYLVEIRQEQHERARERFSTSTVDVFAREIRTNISSLDKFDEWSRGGGAERR